MSGLRRWIRLQEVAACVAAVLMSGCGGESTRRLTLLHTSDIHGQVLPYDDVRQRPARGSLAQVATVVEGIRAEVDHPVLLLDSGDTLQGDPLEQFTHVRWGRPSPTIQAMNGMGYAAMAVGNHEFNFGLEVLGRARELAVFPFLSANTVRAADGEPAFAPFVVLEAADLRVGVLGLTTPNIPGWELPEHYQGLAFEPMDEAARRWVPVLREQERCDLVVVLAHTGFERDPDTGEESGTDHEDFAWRLCQVTGIDVLLTGHSHRDIPPRKVAGVVVSQPAAHARVVTRVDLELARARDSWRVASWQGENLAVGDAPAAADVLAAFADDRARVVEALDARLAEAEAPVSVRGCRLADCAALDLVHDVQLAASGAELSLASLLSDRTPDLAPGPLSWRWVHGLYVYPNTLVAVRVKGAQVKEILEHAAGYYDGLDCPPEGGCTLLADPDVARYNVDSMAGASYRIDPTRPEGDRVLELAVGGRPIDLHGNFILVVNNYRAAGGGGYPHLADAEVVWQSADEMTDLIGDRLAALEQWRPSVDGNWSVVGEPVSETPLKATR